MDRAFEQLVSYQALTLMVVERINIKLDMKFPRALSSGCRSCWWQQQVTPNDDLETTVFSYIIVQLLAVHAPIISLAIVGVLLGIQAYREEGVMRDMEPSSIIEASRASNLDAMGTNGEVRIGYGLVHDETGRSVRSFGMEGNVTQQQARL